LAGGRRRVVGGQVRGYSKENAGDVVQIKIVCVYQREQQLARRGVDGFRCVRGGDRRAPDASDGHTATSFNRKQKNREAVCLAVLSICVSRGVYSNASNGTGAGAVKVRVKVEAQTAFHAAGKIAHIAERSQAFSIGSLHKRLPPFLG
jgi:hypothetical protein